VFGVSHKLFELARGYKPMCLGEVMPTDRRPRLIATKDAAGTA
jgi:hypothetical protein